jgi:hypothetical protein
VKVDTQTLGAGAGVEAASLAASLGSIGSSGHVLNTSPFGSQLSDSVGAIVSTFNAAGVPGSSGSPSSTGGGSGGSVALLPLGDGEYLAVSATVGGSLIGPQPSGQGLGGGPSGPPVASQFTAGGVSNGADGGTVLPPSGNTAALLSLSTFDVGNLITYPGQSASNAGSQQISALAEGGGVPNPEPASLILLGTGLLIVVRRFTRPKGHAE